jgi:hypothetical protein
MCFVNSIYDNICSIQLISHIFHARCYLTDLRQILVISFYLLVISVAFKYSSRR